jgi:4-cresol dehydrogenase (hydroxylating)
MFERRVVAMAETAALRVIMRIQKKPERGARSGEGQGCAGDRSCRFKRSRRCQTATNFLWQKLGIWICLPTKDGVYILDLSALREIRALIRRHCAEIEPGVTQGRLDETLRVHGGSHYFNVTGAGLGASVIGNALERGIGYSGQRHLDLLDLEVVLPTGELVRTSRFSMRSQAAAYLGGLGPDPTGLFCQSNFGVVTAAAVALQRRPEVMGGIVCHLDNRARFSELVSIVSDLLAEGACYGVPHFFNRERVITTLSAHLEEGRAADLRSQASPWMALIPIKRCKAVFEASAQQLRNLLAPLGRIEILRAGPDAGVSRLMEGRPTDLALPSVAFAVFGRSAPFNAPVESSGAGLIHVTPIVPLCGNTAARTRPARFCGGTVTSAFRCRSTRSAPGPPLSLSL